MVNAGSNYKGYFDLAGWGLALIVPLIIYQELITCTNSQELVIFVSAFSSAIVMWIFRLIPEYLPGVLVITTCAALGLAPTSVILAGFSSETFIMVLSVLTITILIARSNLIPRFILTLLNLLPKRSFSFDFAFFIGFTFLTPFIPSIISRTHLVGKSIADFANIFKLQKQSEQITQMTVSAFFGTSLFSSIFLSASLMNFIILALLPLQEQLQFQTGGWLEASLAAFALMFVGYIVLFKIFFRRNETFLVTKEMIEQQLKTLGPVSKDERNSLAVIISLTIGMLTFSYHAISPTWIAFGIVYVLLAFNQISREEMLSKVDWLFLILMATVIGLSSIMNYFNISGEVAATIHSFTNIFEHAPGLLFSFFVILTIVTRFFLPIGATIALLIPIFIMLAGVYGVAAWAACFTCLMVTDIWFFKYQCIFYTPMTDALEKAGIPFNERKFLIFNALTNILRLLAIFASLHYWHWIGV